MKKELKMNLLQLTNNLSELKLKEMSTQYLELARLSENQKSTYEQFLFKLTEVELEHRREARIRRLILEAKLPVCKDLDNYDYNNRTGITAQEINRLKEGQFVNEASNVVLFGSFGVGKTHLAIGLIKALCEKNFHCLYTSTNGLIERLLEAKNNLTLAALWKRLDRFDVIACDELGYLPQSQEGADLLFQFISQRYERKSLIITTNLAYSEWDKVFINPTTTAATVDRIIHKCETFNIKGPSWRAECAQRKIKDKK